MITNLANIDALGVAFLGKKPAPVPQIPSEVALFDPFGLCIPAQASALVDVRPVSLCQAT